MLRAFKKKLDDCVHLGDIDALWENHLKLSRDVSSLSKENDYAISEVRKNLENVDGQIVQLDERLSEQLNRIENTTSVVEVLKTIAHLKDVDNLWESSGEHATQLEKLRLQNNEIENIILRNQELINQELVAEKNRTDVIMQQLNKKIQYAYWVVGGTITLALVELGLILLR